MDAPDVSYAWSGDVAIAYQELAAGIEFEDRGIHELKGVPGKWRLYAVSGP